MATFQLNLPETSLYEFNVDVCETPYEDDDIPSPPPLFRMNCLSEYSPPLEEQMSKIYKLDKGNVYTFKVFYSLHSRDCEEFPEEITGIFVKFHTIKVFWFIVDGELIEVNYRNFCGWHVTDLEQNVTLYSRNRGVIMDSYEIPPSENINDIENQFLPFNK